MAERNPPLYTEGGTYSALLDRLGLGAIFRWPGIVKQSDLAATFGAGMVTNIAAGSVIIPGTGSALGKYFANNSSSVALTHVGGEASPRKDLIVARINDNFYDSGGVNTWTLEIVKGTAGVSPAEPAAPASSYILHVVNIPGGSITALGSGGATFTDRRGRAGAQGAAIVAKNSEFDTLVGTSQGEYGVAWDAGRFYIWDGAQWNQPNRLRYYKGYTPTGVEQTAGASSVWPTGLTLPVVVPQWVSKARALAVVHGAYAATNLTNINLNLKLGGVLFDTTNVRWNPSNFTTASDPFGGGITDDTRDKMLVGTADVSSLAGTTVNLELQNVIVGGSGIIRVNANSDSYIELDFL